MTNMACRVTVGLVCAAAAASALAAETFRCGSKLIELGMTQSQVLQYCGEPSAKSEEIQDVRSAGQVVGKTTLHRWTFESYSGTRVLKFDQDRLIAIE